MGRTKPMIAAAAAMALLTGMQAAPRRAPAATAGAVDLALWRLDCGTISVADLDAFSDTFQYRGRTKTLTSSCYLIKHGGDYMIWDTGLPLSAIPKPMVSGPFTMGLRATLASQLARISVTPADVDFVGISHSHGDHTGQAADFPQATLLMGPADFDAVKASGGGAKALAPWIEDGGIDGGAKYEPVARDRDVFGDGRVVMLDMPGHTPGHKALFVDLASGPVLLTGDLYHFTEQVANAGVPSFNADRSDTLGSFDRFRAIARNRRAKVIIQHEPDDIAKLPAFPRAAR